jgi:hypothetical protein
MVYGFLLCINNYDFSFRRAKYATEVHSIILHTEDFDSASEYAINGHSQPPNPLLLVLTSE